MESTVAFRDFEERDIDFIYKCKNDEKLNSMIVGNWHPFTREEAEKWVHGCMGEHETFKFWAVCTNDDEKRIVGWVSLSNIDKKNRSACFHGIVIADQNYRNGLAWMESCKFIYKEAFEVMGLNRVFGSCRVDHKLSMSTGPAFFSQIEGYAREAVFVDGKFIDICYRSLLAREYFEHKNAGDYEMSKILRRMAQSRRQKNN